MNIALVILHADSARGGAERYTIDLAQALVSRGHRVCLLASSFGPIPDGLDIQTISARGATRSGRYRAFLDGLDQHLNRVHYDIVHAMLPVRRCDVYHPHAGIAADMTHWSDRLLRPRRSAMAMVERKLLLDPHGPVVLCLSDYIKRFVKEHYPLPEDRLATLFNAVDLDRFAPRQPSGVLRQQLNTDKPLLLMIANDLRRKGFGQVLKAMELLGPDAPALVVMGRESIEPWRRHMPAGAIVHHVGLVDDPRPFYADADALILPTHHDPCSLVVLEALAMGLPVISTRQNGACQIMTDGVHGYVLSDPDDILALADAIRKLLDLTTRTAMKQACLSLRPQLSYQRHLDTLLCIYATRLR